MPTPQTFEELFLDRPVTQPRLVGDIYKDSSSFKTFTFFLSCKPNFYRWVLARQVIREVPGHAAEQESHLDFFAIFYCRRIFFLNFKMDITRTL